MAHELPKLPYDFAALEPHIDAQTMQIHHGKHHQTYVTNLNNALQSHPDLQGKSVEDLCKGINSIPEAIRTAYTIVNTSEFSVHGILAQLVKSNELSQHYLTAGGSVRKTWNNWMRLRRRRKLPETKPTLNGG